MPVLKLTPTFMASSLTCEGGKKKTEFCDIEMPGLYALVHAASPGRATYYLRYKDSTGKTCHLKIGKTSEINLTDARKEAKRLKAEMRLIQHGERRGAYYTAGPAA